MHRLTTAERARLKSLPDLWRHVEVKRYFYRDIAREVRAWVSDRFPLLKNPSDRIPLIATLIQQTDPDIWGLKRGEMTVPEMCKLFAKTALDHEDDSDEE